MTSRAQGAIEYLLIIGAAILVVAIVIIAVTSVLQQGQNQSSIGVSSANDSFDSLKENSGAYVKLSNKYYLKSEPIVSGLVESLRLNNFSNNSFADSSGSGVAAVCDPGKCPLIVNGLWSQALEFNSLTQGAANDGNCIYLTVLPTSNLDFGTRDFTVSLWFNTRDKPSGGGNADTLIARGITDRVGDYGRFWCWIDYGQLSCSIANNSYSIPNASHYVNFGTFNLNEWYHLVFIKKSDSISIYKQGSLVQRTNLPAGYVTDFTANPFPITIGAEGRMGYFFNGYIQEVSIWNRALSATDVNLLYQNSSVK